MQDFHLAKNKLKMTDLNLLDIGMEDHIVNTAIFISILIKKSSAYFYMVDYSNNHEYHSGGIARADDNKLTIGGIKHFTIVEYPHPIDTNVERKSVINHVNGTAKIATWKMVLDGLHGSLDCNAGNRTYYKADY